MDISCGQWQPGEGRECYPTDTLTPYRQKKKSYNSSKFTFKNQNAEVVPNHDTQVKILVQFKHKIFIIKQATTVFRMESIAYIHYVYFFPLPLHIMTSFDKK